MNPITQSPYKEALEAFLKYCHRKTYQSKVDIIKIGDIGDRLFFVIDGSLAVCAENEESDNGHELILAYLGKHEFIGEIGIFKGAEVRKVNVRTREPCVLAEISYVRLKQVLCNELLPFAPDILYLIGDQLAGRLLATSRKLCELAFIDVEGRIAHALLDLCKSADAITHPDGMQLHISRQELGRIVGCSREMAGRVLKELELKGVIASHGKTIVVYNTR
ncbi:MAG: cAMP-activated global transcriptional regulator CRP [Methylococcales bacterium]|nr:cAMP-activated global transcriptional regulator CRP [Methylococcales bacterium]